MGILDTVLTLLKLKKGGADTPVIDPKAAYRTDEQETAVFYFSPENVKPADFKGCLTKAKGCIKGCFPKKPKVEGKKGCFDKKEKGKGCFSKGRYVSDSEYDAIIKNIVTRLDPKARGLQKLVLDESQIEKTITFSNYVYDWDTYWRISEDDGKFRSSKYEVTYIFFTRDQVAAYQLTLSSDWEKHDEYTFEIHYKDVTAFKTSTEQEDTLKTDKDGGKKKEYRTVSNIFKIIVPGDELKVSLSNKPTQEEEGAIQAMKAMLREKKSK